MLLAFILLVTTIILTAALWYFSKQWQHFTHNSRLKHFITAVNTAIALRFESEMSSRTRDLQKQTEHWDTPDSESEAGTQNNIKLRRQMRDLSKFASDFAELMQYQCKLKHLSQSEFQLDEAITFAVRRFSQQHQSHNGEIILRLPENVSESFLGCAETLQQLTFRLLEGVWFRGDIGDIILGVEIHKRNSKTFVRLAVSSAFGRNILGKAAELFLPFAAKGASRRGASDMELSLARHAAFLMRGSLQARATEHSGISFIASIPVIPIQAKSPQKSKEQPPETGAPPITGKSVLIIETSTSETNTLRESLEKWGNKVDVFKSGREALQHIRTKLSSPTGNVYDYLFIDETTEDFEYSIVMHYVLSNPKAIRRIVLIARRSPKASQREPGVHGVLEKPISRNSLASLISSIENPVEQELQPSNRGAQEAHSATTQLVQSVFVPALKVPAEDLLRNVPEPQPKQKLCGLVVDDNLVNMHTIAGVLRQRSMDVLVAENGKEALEIFLQNAQALDFILMDVQMPEMDGCEATRRIRSFERERESRIPIIALTAFAKKEDRKRCLEAGMDDFISKGATPEALFEKINSLLNRKIHVLPSFIEDSKTN